MTKSMCAAAVGGLVLALMSAGCDVAGTAVRTTGKAAGETTKAAGDVAETAAHGAGNAVELTTKKVDEAVH